jgi:inner membrane protein
METLKKIKGSLSGKGIAIAILTLVLLIPSAMIRGLIEERQERSRETIQKINDKWSSSQTLCAPLLLIPYTSTITTLDTNKKVYHTMEERTLFITPKELKINASLTPEERYYGIYKAILYESNIHVEGNFSGLTDLKIENGKFHFDRAKIAIGITDLKGVTQNPSVKISDKMLETTVGTVKLFSVSEVEKSSRGYKRDYYPKIPNKTLIVNLESINLADSLPQSLDFDFANESPRGRDRGVSSSLILAQNRITTVVVAA